jgi:hypothetical protein
MKHVFISSMLFVNYQTMSCNVFELLNVFIGLVIIFGVIFLFKLWGFNVLYLQKYTWIGFCFYAAGLLGQEPINRAYWPIYQFVTISN